LAARQAAAKFLCSGTPTSVAARRARLQATTSTLDPARPNILTQNILDAPPETPPDFASYQPAGARPDISHGRQRAPFMTIHNPPHGLFADPRQANRLSRAGKNLHRI